MQAKTMEGLIGAGMNMKMVDVPMRAYKEARRKDDFGAMERAMGYAGDFAKKADNYQTLADEGMKEDAKDAREKLEEERLKADKKRREEYEKTQERIEAGKEAENENGIEGNQEISASAGAGSLVRIDTVEVSEEGRKLLAESQKGNESSEE